jgi:hypothetical protein
MHMVVQDKLIAHWWFDYLDPLVLMIISSVHA